MKTFIFQEKIQNVEVFATNVEKYFHANWLIALLQNRYPDSTINFDLDDCDRILRMEGGNFNVEEVISLLKEFEYDCKLLE